MILQTFGIYALACFLGLVSFVFQQTRAFGKICYVVLGGALILFVATRDLGSDQDSIGYANYFGLDDYGMSLAAEPTFVVLSGVARFISVSDGLFWLFLIYGFLGVVIKLVAIDRLTEFKWLSIIVYISSYFLLHEFTQIRAGIASGLLLLALKPIVDRDPVRFSFLLITATFFHYSAAVALPLYFLGNKDLDKKTFFILLSSIPAGMIIRLTNYDIFSAIPVELVRIKLETYSEVEKIRDLKLNVFNAVYLVKYSILYIFLFLHKKIQEKSPYFTVIIKIYAISMFSYLALSTNAVFAMRFSELFGIVEIILIPMLCYAIRPKIISVLFIITYSAINIVFNIYWSDLVQNI